MEHKSLRYTWELVRHIYLVDLGSDIEIRLVGITPRNENRLLDPPYPITSCFEIEIDQIQKHGKTVFSLRNICPVQIRGNAGWNFVHSVIKTGGSRVTKRFQSHDGEIETRWLYTDDFFLISASSGDRHDLDMLISLIVGKLNTIALSIQSGKRIPSEFENQQKFRAAMSTMFSEGVDGAFRDVPVYAQHGDMTGSEIDVSGALMSAEFQDLMAVCASEEGAAVPAIPAAQSPQTAAVSGGNGPAEGLPTPPAKAETDACDSVPDSPVPGIVTGSALAESVPEASREPESVPEFSPLPESIPEASREPDSVPEPSSLADSVPEANMEPDSVPEHSSLPESVPEASVEVDGVPEPSPLDGSVPEEGAPEPVTPEEPARMTAVPKGRCSSCGGPIFETTKFCGNCGVAVSSARLPDDTPDPAAITASSSGNPTPAPSRLPVTEPAVNLKTIEELEDLSWLSD